MSGLGGIGWLSTFDPESKSAKNWISLCPGGGGGGVAEKLLTKSVPFQVVLVDYK